MEVTACEDVIRGRRLYNEGHVQIREHRAQLTPLASAREAKHLEHHQDGDSLHKHTHVRVCGAGEPKPAASLPLRKGHMIHKRRTARVANVSALACAVKAIVVPQNR